jgi:hypothetical protein
MIKHLVAIAMAFSATSAVAERVLPDGFSINAYGGIATMGTKLDGTGFAGDLSSSKARAFGGEIGKNWAKGFKMRLRYTFANSDFNPPSAVQPSVIKGARNEFLAYGLINPGLEGWLEDVWIGVGYTYLTHKYDDSVPAIATSQMSQGLTLAANVDPWFNDSWGAGFLGLIYMPNTFSEKKVSTGVNPKYLGIEADFRLKFRWREDLYIYTGGRYRRDSVRFDGTGNRSVTAATDTRTEITVPVGFHYDF